MANKIRIELGFVPGSSVRDFQRAFGDGVRALRQDIAIGIAARVFGAAEAGRDSFARTWGTERDRLERHFRFVPPERTTVPSFYGDQTVRNYIISRMRDIAYKQGHTADGGYLPHYERSGELNKAWNTEIVDNTGQPPPVAELGDTKLMKLGTLDLGKIRPDKERKVALVGLKIENRAVDELGMYYAGYVYGLPQAVGVAMAEYNFNGLQEAGYKGALGESENSQLPWHAEQGWPNMTNVIDRFSRDFTSKWEQAMKAELGKDRFGRTTRPTNWKRR